MLRRLIFWLFASCPAGTATDAANRTPNCTSPTPHNGQAESAVVTFSVLDVDGAPAGNNTVWQPLGGTVSFSLYGNGLADKPPIAWCRATLSKTGNPGRIASELRLSGESRSRTRR